MTKKRTNLLLLLLAVIEEAEESVGFCNLHRCPACKFDKKVAKAARLAIKELSVKSK